MSDEVKEPSILLVGDVIDGVKPIGPFESMADATVWAMKNIRDNWVAAPLIAPAKAAK